MELTKKVQTLKRELPHFRHRLAGHCRRICAVVICASLVLGGFPSAFFQAFAADESEDYVYELDRTSIYEALDAAIAEGTTLDNELDFMGDHKGEYDELFEPDGTLYELKELETNDDAERDKALGLRVFVRIQGDIGLDEEYRIEGTEDVIFLFTNKTDIEHSAQIVLEDCESEMIVIPPAKDIPVDISEVPAVAAPSPTMDGGPGSGGAGADISIEIESDGDSDQDVFNEDSEVTFEADDESDPEDVTDEGREKDSSDSYEAEDEGSSDSEASSDDAESGEKSDADSDGKSDDASSSEDSSEKSGTGDTSDDKDSSDKDSSGDKNTSDDKTSSNDKKDSSNDKESSNEKGSSHRSGSARNRGLSNNRDSSDKDSGNDGKGEKTASISANRTAVLAASLDAATKEDESDTTEERDADADTAEADVQGSVIVYASPSDASPSNASSSDASRNRIDGTIYDPVRLGNRGAVAFVTTTSDLGFDTSSEIYSLTYEGEDYRITVEFDENAQLPNDVALTGEEYDKDSDTFIDRYEEAKEFYGWGEGKEPAARLFDVSLLSGEEKVEPASAVDVIFTFFDDNDSNIALYSADADEDKTGFKSRGYKVVHFGDDGTETVDADIDTEDDGQTVSFRLESFSDIMVFAYTGSGQVVLNLGNGNGTYSFADYTGSTSAGGSALRYTTAANALDSYADTTGDLYITLPSDNDLGTTFTLAEDNQGVLPSVTLELGREAEYNYKLVGWVNIANGEYYDVSNGSVGNVPIDLNKENVFYADWIADSYDYGSSEDSGLINTVSTKDFVTMHMYDYNELFNLYSESVAQSGTTSEVWTDSQKLYDTRLGATLNGTELTNSFIFANTDTVSSDARDSMITVPASRYAGNVWTGSGKPPVDAKTMWNITSPTSAPLNLLFDPASTATGVHYVGEADNLFWIDDDGYYTYNSQTNAATYNQSDGRFYVYDAGQLVRGAGYPCFLPFNKYEKVGSKDDSPYYISDGTVNYWFGMDMTVDFYLADAVVGGQSNNNKLGDKDIIFNFSGDDDIFIFIDNDLVLDMSGIHDESYGSINFTNGTVTMGMKEDLSDGTTTNFDLRAGAHTLRVFYMERGGNASNLEIQFNVTPLWEYETGDVQTVVAEKVWARINENGEKVVIDPEDLNDILPDVYKNTGIEVGLFDVLTEKDGDTVGYTKSGNIYTVEFTDDSGVTRKYEYDASGPSLTYTETSDGSTIVSGTDSTTDSEGRVIDKDGYVVAWLDDDTGKLYIRMDKQTLSADNDWTYAWELLDPEGIYEVLELSEDPNIYNTETSTSNLTEYMYWSIIGDAEIEDYLEGDNGDLPVILTEAAQEAEEKLGNTSEAYGYVIAVKENGELYVDQVKFSQIATLDTISDSTSGKVSYFGTYGVTSQGEIDGLDPSTAVWYIEDAGHSDTDVNGSGEAFYLYCMQDSTKYYLALDSAGTGLTVTTTEDNKSEFYYDPLGELMIYISSGNSGSSVRVEIDEEGVIQIDTNGAEQMAATDDVRIYTLTETATSGFTFTAVNTLIPDIALIKVDADSYDTDTGDYSVLPGASFTLQQSGDGGLYYGEIDPTTGLVIWSDEPVNLTTDNNPESDTYGEYIFHYLPDGEYILTEVVAPDGYNLLPGAILIEIQNGVIYRAIWEDESLRSDSEYSGFILIADWGLEFIIKNQLGGSILPEAGGFGTMPFIVAGMLIISSAVWLYITLRRRRRWLGS